MSKKRKNAKQRLNVLLMLLLLTTILMIMSTYAWFTANKQVNIDGIDVNVATTNGLQISADGVNWTSVVDINDLLGAKKAGYTDAVNQLPSKMAPTSATGVCHDGKMDMYYGTVYAQVENKDQPDYNKFYLNTTKETDIETVDRATAKGYYTAFDVFIKNGSDSDDFYLTGQVNEITRESGTPQVQIDESYEKGITNSARVGILVGGNTTSEDVDTIRGLSTQPTGNGGKAYIWEPNYKSHKQEALSFFNAELRWPGFTALMGSDCRTDGVKSEITKAILLEEAYADKHAEAFEQVNPKFRTPKNTRAPIEPQSFGVPLKRGVTKFRIYCWIEGQDIDCENHAANSDLRFDISFKIDK